MFIPINNYFGYKEIKLDVKRNKLTEKILQNKHASHKRMALDTKVQTD